MSKVFKRLDADGDITGNERTTREVINQHSVYLESLMKKIVALENKIKKEKK